MNLVLLYTWSCILIFVWMVRKKYRWTVPPYRVAILFALAGVNATIPSALCNYFISSKTDFWVYSGNVFESFMGFFLGAGMGEEFFKFSAGLLLLLAFGMLGIRTSASTRFLGFVVVGLSFAAIENWQAYGAVPFWTMMTRGVLAVPLHASMGMIHGHAVNRAYANSSIVPLFGGYLYSAILHAFYDTANLFLPDVDPRYYLYPLVVVLMSWGLRQWDRLPERDDLTTADLPAAP